MVGITLVLFLKNLLNNLVVAFLNSIFNLFKHKTPFEKAIKKHLGFYPQKIGLFKKAFTPPFIDKINNYERLEYLGDAVLSIIVSDYLFKKYTQAEEGFLTDMRSKIVNKKQLQQFAFQLNLVRIIEIITHNDTSTKTNFHNISSITADIFESLLAAIYLEKGFKFSKEWLIGNVLIPYISFEDLALKDGNIKNSLLAWAAKNNKVVELNTIKEERQQFKTLFYVHCLVDKNFIAEGVAYNKKDAGILAAEKALLILEKK